MAVGFARKCVNGRGIWRSGRGVFTTETQRRGEGGNEQEEAEGAETTVAGKNKKLSGKCGKSGGKRGKGMRIDHGWHG
jgi:hypothetical protein